MSFTIAIVTSDIGIECAVGSFFTCLLPDCVEHIVRTPKQLELPSEDFIHELKTHDEVYLVGNFFKDIAYYNGFETESGEIRFESQFNMVPFEKEIAPIRYLLEEFNELLNHEDVKIKLFLKHNREAIDLIDNRIRSINNNETQDFITGMFNAIPERTNSAEDICFKYKALFSGDLTLEDVRKLGRSILTSQLLMVKDRILKNSRYGTFTDGTRYRITEATELINMCHDELNRDEEDPNLVTITLSLKLTEKPEGDLLHYSMRSKTKNVQEIIVNNTSGNGFIHSAGGTKPINLMLSSFIV